MGNVDDLPVQFGNGVTINLLNVKAKDFYWLLINKTYTAKQMGPTRLDAIILIGEGK